MGFDSIYIVLPLKTKPQKLEINGVSEGLLESQLGNFSGNIILISAGSIIDYTPTTPIHPSTSTSINPPFSKWVISHGDDYGGNDSKCSSCHGNLDAKPSSYSEVANNKSFCYMCHYGKSGTGTGFAGQVGCMHPYPAPPESMITPTPTASPTAIPTTPTPKTPAFETLSSIAALVAVLLFRRR